MKKTFRILICAALAIASSFLHACAATLETVHLTARFAKNLLVDAFMGFARPAHEPVQLVPKIQARQYQQRIEKRERPVVTSAWRMCPST